jgi:hypothetical protein
VTDGGEDEGLVLDLEATERYRNRAKAVAALAATASGVLAAGLVLNPTLLAYPLHVRLLITLSIVFLLVATCIFVVASVVRASEGQNKSTTSAKMLRILRPWETVIPPKSNGDSPDADYRSSIHQVQRHIARTTNVGLWMATFGVLLLVASLAALLPASQETQTYSAQAAEGSALSVVCGALPNSFPVSIRSLDYRSEQETLRVVIRRSDCLSASESGNITLFVNRADLLLFGSVE